MPFGFAIAIYIDVEFFPRTHIRGVLFSYNLQRTLHSYKYKLIDNKQRHNSVMKPAIVKFRDSNSVYILKNNCRRAVVLVLKLLLKSQS